MSVSNQVGDFGWDGEAPAEPELRYNFAFNTHQPNALATENAGCPSLTRRTNVLPMRRCIHPSKWVALVFLFFAHPFSAAAEPELQRFSASQPQMGVEFEVIVYASEERQAKEAQAVAFARIAELNRIFSDYDPASEALTWCASAPHASAVPLSADLARVVRFSCDLHRQAEGAFNITIGPLTKLWRRARRQGELPAAEAVRAARELVEVEHVAIDPKQDRGRLLRKEMRLDFGGIVKGYAADEALQAIRKLGFSRALVRGSGDIALGDPPPGAAGWRVGIAPLDADAEPTEFLTLANVCVSTSGDARQHLVVDGKRYSHILDPRTGWPVSGRSSVTVVAPRGYLADGLATAVSVLGAEEGKKLLDRTPEVKGLLIFEQDRQQTRTESMRWKE